MTLTPKNNPKLTRNDTVGLKKKGKKSKKVTTEARTRGNSRAAQVLEIIKSSKNFYVGYTDPACYVGHCIHCDTMITATMSGDTSATVEHIMPICAGGSATDLSNVALACKACNNEKGIRHDARRLGERALEVIAALLKKRASQMKTVTSDSEIVYL